MPYNYSWIPLLDFMGELGSVCGYAKIPCRVGYFEVARYCRAEIRKSSRNDEIHRLTPFAFPVDWNAELVRGDLGTAVAQLKRKASRGLLTAGVTLPLALAELGLIDEYEFIVHPRLAGHGPTLFDGLSNPIDLKLVSRLEFGSGAVAMRYEPITVEKLEPALRLVASVRAMRGSQK
jgi:hypothetical protein